MSLLEARALTKTFGGVVALDRLDLAVERNEILGLIGPNGSGKTTFFNVVTGIYGADHGDISFDGAPITTASPQAVYHAGISRTFQRSRLSLPLVDLRQHHGRQPQAIDARALVQPGAPQGFQARIRCGLCIRTGAGRSVRAAAGQPDVTSRLPACR